MTLQTIETLDPSPFKRMVMTIGTLPSAFTESMTYYEALCWFSNYLQKEVIPAVNNNAAAVEELQTLFIELKNYVDNYFDNLDVQEEIDHKLDEMAEDGTLAEIIAQYVQLKAVLSYNTVADMKEATNLVNGSFAVTNGFNTLNDGGKAQYFVREITNEDDVDEITIISLADENLVAVLLPDTKPNCLQFGCVGDGTTDDTAKLQAAINYCEIKDKTLIIPSRTFGVTQLEINNIKIEGNGTLKELDIANEKFILHITSGCEIDGISFFSTSTAKAIRVENESGEVIIRNSYFTGNATEYIVTLNENTLIENNVFDNKGYKVTHMVRFSTGSDFSTFRGNRLYDASGFNIQTYNVSNVTIEDNKILNPCITQTITPSDTTLSLTITTTELNLKRFGVFVDGVITPSASVVNNTDGTYTINFTNAVTSSNEVKFYGWKSLENVNINGGCSKIRVINNVFQGTGDSNVVVGNDFTETLDNPKEVQIVGNLLSDAHDAGIMCISGGSNHMITGNQIYNPSIACNQANYDTGIIINNCPSSVVTSNSVYVNDSASVAQSAISCTNYSSNFYNRNKGEYTKLGSNSTNLPIVYLRGLGSESQEGLSFDLPSVAYPASPDLDGTYSSGRPADDDYFTYTASGGGVQKNTSDMYSGEGCIMTNTATSAYINIRPTLTALTKYSLVTFRMLVKAVNSGDKCNITTYQMNNAGTVLNGTTHVLEPSASEWEVHEFQVKASGNETNTATRLRIGGGGTGNVLIDNISVTYQPLV